MGRKQSMSRDWYVISLDELRMGDVERVGGKNASLGEMISQLAAAGIRVPGGFATTAAAFRDFLKQAGLTERINGRLKALDPEDVAALAKTGAEIRGWVVEAPLPAELEGAIRTAYQDMMRAGEAPVAVRSSATAEDLPDASFAGQQETFLNIHGLDGGPGGGSSPPGRAAGEGGGGGGGEPGTGTPYKSRCSRPASFPSSAARSAR